MSTRSELAELVWTLIRRHNERGQIRDKTSCLSALDLLAQTEPPAVHSLFVSALADIDSYFNDIAIDTYQIMTTERGTPFVHYTPESGCGSHIIIMQPDSWYPATQYDTVPYLFGTANRDKLCRDKTLSAKYFHESERYNVRYFDGKGWTFITTLAAVEIVREYCSRMQSRWFEAEQKARRRELGIAV